MTSSQYSTGLESIGLAADREKPHDIAQYPDTSGFGMVNAFNRYRKRCGDAAGLEGTKLTVLNHISPTGMVMLLGILVTACGNRATQPQDAAPDVQKENVHANDYAESTPKTTGFHDQAMHETGIIAIKNGFYGMPFPYTTVQCPVTKENFVVSTDPPHSVYEGKTYVFCCSACKPRFDANPMKFTNDQSE